MEQRYQTLGNTSRQLKVSDIGPELPAANVVGDAIDRLREAYTQGLEADLFPRVPVSTATPVEEPPRDRVLAAPLPPLPPQPTGRRYEESGHVWEIKPASEEGKCTQGDGGCGKPSRWHATYHMPSGKLRTWRLCDPHGRVFEASHHLAGEEPR